MAHDDMHPLRICEDCEAAVARTFCKECDMAFCRRCCRLMHSQGSMRVHESQGCFSAYTHGAEPFRVLIFDDSPIETQALSLLCEKYAYVTAVASTEDEAVALLTHGTFDLLVLDYHQPAPFECIEFLRRIAELGTAVALTSANDR